MFAWAKDTVCISDKNSDPARAVFAWAKDTVCISDKNSDPARAVFAWAKDTVCISDKNSDPARAVFAWAKDTVCISDSDPARAVFTCNVCNHLSTSISRVKHTCLIETTDRNTRPEIRFQCVHGHPN